ncbi:MAG TPA: CapA family protein [Clostridiales bacterium]|jgi:poly-gamma-glutamate synthesis protein (capsule biosynthesis protein)|nr:CapA family protein [Clostridiales bacterium]
MFKRLLIIFLVLLLLLPSFSVASDEEVSLSDTLQGFTALPGGLQTGGQPTLNPQEPLGIETEPDKLRVTENGSKEVIITAVGDTTIGGDVRKGLSIFDKELQKHGNDPSFIVQNTKHIFEEDTLTIANFEGTLTTAPIPSNKRNNQFLFSAPPEYVSFLKEGSIEAVSFENNHVMDHGEKGNLETRQHFEEAGILYAAEDHMAVFERDNVLIAMLAYQTFNGRYPELFEKVPREVAAAKEKHDIVIVSYHWGDELDYYPNDNQVKLGRATIDAGADLVLGHHSHRINPIEFYKGRYIVYSLANYSFAGNKRPSDMSTFFFQVKFYVKDGQTATGRFRIIPARISSKSDYNDFIPTPYTEQRHIDNVINCLLENGKRLEYAVTEYPTEW